MGLSLRADETQPVPRAVEATLTCDAPECGGIIEDRATFRSYEPLIDARRAATALGWAHKEDGRYLCPVCAKGD